MVRDKILQRLILSNDYVSGETISDELNISRNAVNKHIKRLRELGWIINSITNKGYVIESHDKVIHPLLFKDKVNDFKIFKTIDILPTVDSTVKEGIRRILNNKIKEPTLIISDKQEKGLSQSLKTFDSPNQLGIYISLCFETRNNENYSKKLLLAALNELNSLSKYHLQMSFPKGVFYKNKRYCSTLTYNVENLEKGITTTIIGLGMYTNYSQANSLSRLSEIIDKDIDRVELITNIIKRFESLIGEL